MLSPVRPFFLPGTLVFDSGSSADYRTLARFHYVPARPATWAAVVRCRWLPDDGPARLVGVAVLSHPSALHRTRHRVFGLKPMRFGERLRWVNAHVRTISRVVIHPQFRGLGLSTELIARAVAACPTRFVEASARMGRAHPLFERAGFTRVEPMIEDEPLYFWRECPTPSTGRAEHVQASLAPSPAEACLPEAKAQATPVHIATQGSHLPAPC